MEPANSSLAHSQSPHWLSETHALAGSGHERADGAESDSWYATAWEEVQEDRKEGNRAFNSPVASTTTIEVQHPTPTTSPARIAQHLKPRPSENPRTLPDLFENGKGSSEIAAEQNTTGRGDTEASDHNSKAHIGVFAGQNAAGAGQVTGSIDDWRAAAVPPHSDAIRHNTTRGSHHASSNQNVEPSARSTSGQSASSVEDTPIAGQPIGAFARPNSGQNITSTEEHANEVPTENIRPTPQNLRYGTYPSQQGPQNRNPPLGSSRLQNTTKLGAYKLKFS